MPEPGITDLNFETPTTVNTGGGLRITPQQVSAVQETLTPEKVEDAVNPETEGDLASVFLQIGAILNPRTGENALRHRINALNMERNRLDEKAKQKNAVQTAFALEAFKNPAILAGMGPEGIAQLSAASPNLMGFPVDFAQVAEVARNRGAPRPLDPEVREQIGLKEGDIGFTADGKTTVQQRSSQPRSPNVKRQTSLKVEDFVKHFPGQTVPEGTIGVTITQNSDGSLADIEFQEAPEAGQKRSMRERAGETITNVLREAREQGVESILNDPERMTDLAQAVNLATVRPTVFVDEQGNRTTTGGMDAMALLPPELQQAVEPLLGRGREQLAEAEAEALPEGIQEAISGGFRSLQLLDVLEKNVGETGGFLFTTGAMGFLKQFLGVDSDAEAFAAARNQMRVEGQAIIKGTPSNFDIQTYIATIPDFFRAQSTNKARIELSRSMLKSMIRDNIAFNKAVGRAIPKEMEMRARLMGISLEPIRPMTDEEMANMGSNQWENLANAPRDVLVDLLNEPGYMDRIPDEYALRIADRLEGSQ